MDRTSSRVLNERNYGDSSHFISDFIKTWLLFKTLKLFAIILINIIKYTLRERTGEISFIYRSSRLNKYEDFLNICINCLLKLLKNFIDYILNQNWNGVFFHPCIFSVWIPKIHVWFLLNHDAIFKLVKLTKVLWYYLSSCNTQKYPVVRKYHFVLTCSNWVKQGTYSISSCDDLFRLFMLLKKNILLYFTKTLLRIMTGHRILFKDMLFSFFNLWFSSLIL